MRPLSPKEAQIFDHFEKANELAVQLFNGIWEDAAMWLQLPEQELADQVPNDLIATGQGERVIELLTARLRRSK